ncbi:MAG: rhomboid family intramembrane serine protease [Bacteroidota bacterium]|nr:rhomboid family intramembrane serine protease [Bacteroidota bacterium]
MTKKTADVESLALLRSLIIPFLFLTVMWFIFGVDQLFDLELGRYGIIPLAPIGLIGIITAPLLHANLGHIAANSIPFLLLFAGLFYYYKDLAWKIILLSWFLTGLGVWCFARGDGSHIGVSGIIYALATFHLLSGIIRKNKRLAAFSLLVAFLYGSLVWGIFPNFFFKENISWESHLMGGISGMILAVYFRHEGPGSDQYSIDDEADESGEGDAEDEEWQTDNDSRDEEINRS